MKLLLTIPLLAVFGVVACASPETTNNRGYTASEEREFMKGCTKGNAPKDYCQCVLEKIEYRYTPQEVDLANQNIKAGRDMPAEWLTIAKRCAISR